MTSQERTKKRHNDNFIRGTLGKIETLKNSFYRQTTVEDRYKIVEEIALKKEYLNEIDGRPRALNTFGHNMLSVLMEFGFDYSKDLPSQLYNELIEDGEKRERDQNGRIFGQLKKCVFEHWAEKSRD